MVPLRSGREFSVRKVFGNEVQGEKEETEEVSVSTPSVVEGVCVSLPQGCLKELLSGSDAERSEFVEAYNMVASLEKFVWLNKSAPLVPIKLNGK